LGRTKRACCFSSVSKLFSPFQFQTCVAYCFVSHRGFNFASNIDQQNNITLLLQNSSGDFSKGDASQPRAPQRTERNNNAPCSERTVTLKSEAESSVDDVVSTRGHNGPVAVYACDTLTDCESILSSTQMVKLGYVGDAKEAGEQTVAGTLAEAPCTDLKKKGFFSNQFKRSIHLNVKLDSRSPKAS
jgi:hypothetical protein